jgi:hypothetical protein
MLACGELDESGGALLHTTAETLAQAGYHRVELDLFAVTSADLAGVRALDNLRVMLGETGVDLTIRNPNIASYPVDWHSILPTDSHDLYMSDSASPIGTRNSRTR